MTRLERVRHWRANWSKAYKAKRLALTAQWRKQHPLYQIWVDMKRRCEQSHRADYPRYGGRGIKCLYKSYYEFVADVGPRPSPDYSVDRINNNWHYEPGNCRWATRKEQMANSRLAGR